METLAFAKHSALSGKMGISMDTLVNFIHKSLPTIKDFHSEMDDSGKRRWVIIHCSNSKILFEIAGLLEKDPYYGKRMSTCDKNIHVSSSEKPQINESILLVNKFYNLLIRSFQKKNISFKINSPAIIVASCRGLSEICIKFTDPDSLKCFIKKIDKNWYPDKKEDDILSIFVTKQQIEKFLSVNSKKN